MQSLYDKLKDYEKSDYIPFHMPGHKRNYEKFGLPDVTGIDITEIDGFDDYHYPEGIIYNIQKQASEIYGSGASFYLINGSSVGILAAISAANVMQEQTFIKEENIQEKNISRKIIVARNSHKAVYNAIYLNDLYPEYIYPKVDLETGLLCGISADEVKETLVRTGAKIVMITSPTYEGVSSDIRSIADVCHRMKAVLIVDSAHGAHFNYSDEFPDTAIKCGADIVIESLHKTLPSYTQTAILHIKSKLVDVSLVKRFLSIYQTSSPSYIFMAGINRCIDYMVSEEGKYANQEYIGRLRELRQKLNALKNIKLFEINDLLRESGMDYDISKIVLVSPKRGVMLYEILLNEYHIQLEMAASNYVIAMTGIGDDFVWYEKLVGALVEIDARFGIMINENLADVQQYAEIFRAEVEITPKKAFEMSGKVVNWNESAGEISKECIYAYPPGIPLIYPGERITEALIRKISDMRKAGVFIKGFQDEKGETILCIK